MNIGEAARRSGLPTKTIRYYESVGLISPARRANGFRDYGEGEVRILRFIGCARGLGFTVEESRDLVGLFADPERASADVRSAARRHVEAVERKMTELEALRGAPGPLADGAGRGKASGLAGLGSSCEGDEP